MSNLHALPLFVSAVAYWLLGALWFSVLFGGIWSRGLESQGITITKPTTPELTRKFVGTFVANLATAIAIGEVESVAGIGSVVSAVQLGLVLGIGVAGMALAVSYTWEGKPRANFLIDASYHVLGVIICSVTLALWR